MNSYNNFKYLIGDINALCNNKNTIIYNYNYKSSEIDFNTQQTIKDICLLFIFNDINIDIIKLKILKYKIKKYFKNKYFGELIIFKISNGNLNIHFRDFEINIIKNIKKIYKIIFETTFTIEKYIKYYTKMKEKYDIKKNNYKYLKYITKTFLYECSYLFLEEYNINKFSTNLFK